MFEENILAFLKYLGFFITAVSSIWALISKTTFEDEKGRKRLTAAGHTTIAITIAAASISMLAFGFETIVKQNAATAAAAKSAADDAKKAAEKEEAQRAESERERKAESRSLEQRYIILSKAAEEKDRQLKLARQVSEGTARNLARTEASLMELRRVQNPIGQPTMSIVFALEKGEPGTEKLFARLAEQGRRLRASPSIAPTNGVFVTSRNEENVPTGFDFQDAADLAPDEVREPELHTLLMESGAEISIYRGRASATRAREALRQRQRPNLGYFGSDGDLAFGIDADRIRLAYHIDSESISIWVDGAPEPRFIRQNGSVLSIPDLEDSYMLIVADDTMVPTLEGDYPLLRNLRKKLTLNIAFMSASGRDFTFFSFETIRTRSGMPAFMTGLLKTALRHR